MQSKESRPLVLQLGRSRERQQANKQTRGEPDGMLIDGGVTISGPQQFPRLGTEILCDPATLQSIRWRWNMYPR